MKRCIGLSLIVISIMVIFSMSALAQAPNEEASLSAFITSLNSDPSKPVTMKDMVSIDGVFYLYLGEAIYQWTPGGALPELYCTLPPIPAWRVEWQSVALQALPADEQAALTGTVDYIAAGDGALWGYNLLAGRIGKITEQGITWMNQVLDTSFMFKDGNIMAYFLPIQAFVEDGKIYMFGDNAKFIEPICEPMALIRFDIATGAYDVLPINMAVNLCRYKPGYFLLLRRGDSSVVTLSVMNRATGSIEDLPIEIPFSDQAAGGLETIGGLAYDQVNDQILFTMRSNVWKSKGGQPFETVAQFTMDSYYRNPAWVLPDGRYASLVYTLHIREVN